MINLSLTIDKRRAKKDGTYPVVFVIASEGLSRYISSGYTSSEEHWNNRTNNIKETHPSFSIIAPRLKELEISYLAKLIKYEKEFPNDTNVQRIKEYLTSKSKLSADVYDFWKEEIALLNKADRNGGAVVYQQSLNAIHKVRNLKIPFERIDYNFLKELEAQFISNGLGINSVGVHYRCLRAIYNKAIKSKLASYENYPFKSYKIRKQATSPRTTSLEEMRKYFNLSMEKSCLLYDSWLLGKLMFMLIGINFKDMILLTEANLKADRAVYSRAKTRKMYSVKLLPEALKIVNFFNGRDANTLFGKLTKTDLENKERLPLIIHQKNKNFNKHLDKLGKMIGCKEKLTGYVFRYTWANIAKQLGYSKDLIAEGLGHQYGSKVTGVYLEAYDKELIDEMNQKIYDTIMTPVKEQGK